MIARRRAIRWTPIANAIVTTAGRPSGTAATARLMPASAASASGNPRAIATAPSSTAIDRDRGRDRPADAVELDG